MAEEGKRANEERPRRRLPVLGASNSPSDPGETEEHPPWHWVAIGVIVSFAVWLPLIFLIQAILPQQGASPAEATPGILAITLVSHASGFALGCASGGALTGRFGPNAGKRETTVVGALVAALAWMLSATQGTSGGGLVWGVLLVVLLALGAASAYAGGRIGIRLRTKKA